jgi:integrase
MHPILLDAAGHRRQPVTLPGYHSGRPPRNKGRRYPADPPAVEEIIAVMRAAGAGADGVRLRALIVLLWRSGLRIGEALALAESDLDARRGAVLIRRGKGDKRREVGMDRWAWEQLEPWQQRRVRLPVGPLLCVIHGPTAGRAWEQASARRLCRPAILHAASQALHSATDRPRGGNGRPGDDEVGGGRRSLLVLGRRRCRHDRTSTRRGLAGIGNAPCVATLRRLPIGSAAVRRAAAA